MGRNNADFQSQVLYHGSSSAIPVGEVIRPDTSWSDDGVAFATDKPEHAQEHGNIVHKVVPVDPEEKMESWQPDWFTYDKPEDMPTVYQSTKGFKVVGRHNG
jgi:hypothetical protein